MPIITSTRAAEKQPAKPQREKLTDEVIVTLGDGRVELGREGGLLGRGEGGSRAGEGEAESGGLHLGSYQGGIVRMRGRERARAGGYRLRWFAALRVFSPIFVKIGFNQHMRGTRTPLHVFEENEREVDTNHSNTTTRGERWPPMRCRWLSANRCVIRVS